MILFFISFYALYGSFLIYASVHRCWKNLSVLDKVILAPFASLYFTDLAFNWIFGGLMFWENPFATMTFTARCKSHLSDEGWRGAEAKFFCKRLNLFDPKHCG